MQEKFDKDIDLLFETSWEVCNKIGGIYAVLSTKARELQKVFGDRLIFIGPDVWTDDNPSPSFIERKTLLRSAASKLALPDGIKIRTGRWDIPGSPLVVLVDFKGMFSKLDGIYGDMWNRFGVDSLNAYGDYDESCAFAVASAIVVKALSQHLKANPSKVIAHFDEWTTGMGLLYLKTIMPEAATFSPPTPQVSDAQSAATARTFTNISSTITAIRWRANSTWWQNTLSKRPRPNRPTALPP